MRSIEGHWLAEYGFPSTHAMSVMGQASMVVWYTFREDYAGKKQKNMGAELDLLSGATVTSTALLAHG